MPLQRLSAGDLHARHSVPGKDRLLRLLGVEVYAVPDVPFDDPENFNHQARRHAESPGNAIWTNQFENTTNVQARIETTGPEIWAQTEGKIDSFTCAPGTGCTLAGMTRYLKTVSNGRVKSFPADPPGNILHHYVQTGGEVIKHTGGSFTEGIGQGRVTGNLKGDIHLLNGSLCISDEKTIEMLYRCLDEEGLYLGPSSALISLPHRKLPRNLVPDTQW